MLRGIWHLGRLVFASSLAAFLALGQHHNHIETMFWRTLSRQLLISLRRNSVYKYEVKVEEEVVLVYEAAPPKKEELGIIARVWRIRAGVVGRTPADPSPV